MYYYNETDETLVMLTLAGEQQAYERLVLRYQSAVIASALAVTHSRFMAEDAAQDAFVTAWMKLNTLQSGSKYCTWVCKIAKNCARNMLMRYRSFMPLDLVENTFAEADDKLNPAEYAAASEDRDEINKAIEGLPARVREIIRLHYFEELSVTEIAERMSISSGTVKWQLHDGRKRIRKELCAMNEKYNDTLVERVMKKVQELKLWQFKNDKSGFEAIYRDVLGEVEELPESMKKNHALADVLLRGWWWIPGEKNDALLKRIADAAIEGRNEEAMSFIVTNEDSKFWGSSKLVFIRDKQIPRLEAAGFVDTLGKEWFWLGYYSFREGKPDEGRAAYDKVREILNEQNSFYNMVPYALRMEEALAGELKDVKDFRYVIWTSSYELRYVDGLPKYWKEQGTGEGECGSFDGDIMGFFRGSSLCDGAFFANIKVGEAHIGSDGTTLEFASDSVSVNTPAGMFEGCQLWVTTHNKDRGKSVFKTYYKDGVGIVKIEHFADGVSDVRVLSAYSIVGGSGLLPFAKGNKWEYASLYPSDIIKAELSYEVSYADENKGMLTSWSKLHRIGYDENSWVDMVQQIANDYFESGTYKVVDVSHAVERAEALAKTPIQKAHTKAAASVVRRIMETNPEFNPKHVATGHWNFFGRPTLIKKDGKLKLTSYNPRWEFELKSMGGNGNADTPLLYNDIYGILQDATRYVWSDEWRIGASPIVEYDGYDRAIKTQIICEDGGNITTKAGTFENCLKLTLYIEGLTNGLSYRGGRKVYYFADGIGIVRTENEYLSGSRTAVYELTEYEGTGEGYMPFEDGMMRKYDALDLTDGFVGSSIYTYVEDENGDIVVFEDRKGIRELPPPITQYSSIQGEQIEERLWSAGNWKEGHEKFFENNIKLMAHFIGRPSRNAHDSARSIALHDYNLKLMEGFSENGVPDAWCGLYAWLSLIKAAAHFQRGVWEPENTEKGFMCLETALAYYKKWDSFKDGELLDLGNEGAFGKAKYIKGEEMLMLPNGKCEPLEELDSNGNAMYYCMTAKSGWWWFDPIREDERFKEYIKRAGELLESK